MNSAVKNTAVKQEVDDPFAAAFAESDVRGRSLWVDAWHRVLKNKAAIVSGVIMTIMVLLVVFGPMLLPWEGDFTDWDNTSSPPAWRPGTGLVPMPWAGIFSFAPSRVEGFHYWSALSPRW